MHIRNFIILLTVLLITACRIGKRTSNQTGSTSNERYLDTLGRKNLDQTGASEKKIRIFDSGVTELSSPESVAIHNNLVYVANIGGKPGKSKGSGFFTRFSLDGFEGKEIEKLFVGKLDDPRGFVFLNDDIMVVADHPSVKILNVATGEVVDTLIIERSGFLNDIAMINKETIVISDSIAGTLYRVILSPDMNSIINVIPIVGLNAGLKGINRITYVDELNKLFLVDSTLGGKRGKGNIYDFTFTADDFSTGTLSDPWLPKRLGSGKLDGIDYTKGHIVVSDWDTGLYIFDVNTKQLLSKGSGVTSVADLTIYDNRVWFPEFLKNKVCSIRLPRALRL